jgi:2-methylcitrate dehydratase PrpD
MHLSALLSQYLISLYYSNLAPEIRTAAKPFLSDTFAVMLAGSCETASKMAADYALEYGKCGAATLVSRAGGKTDAYFAAMANGVAAHVHDFDDVCTTMIGHPSVAILPALLAVGEEENFSGEELLRSYVVGVETCGFLGRLLCPEFNKRGWHSTEAIGVLGSAAAVGCLMGLSEEKLTHALGIAASEACGLKANYGTMTKPFHAGRAAAKGILAARLAKRGFTSSEKALDGESGYIEAFSGVSHWDTFTNAIELKNSEFLNPGLTMKPWPCCKGMHNAIWATMELLQEYDLHNEEIDRIDCRVLPFAKDILIYKIAETPLQGKFSMNYAIAKVVLNRQLVMSDFEGETIADPNLISTMQKIHMVVDESLISNGGYYDPSECEQVDIILKDGRKFSRFCAKAKGTPDNPMTDEERHAKMRDCMSYAVRKKSIPELIAAVEAIDSLASVAELFQIFHAARLS